MHAYLRGGIPGWAFLVLLEALGVHYLDPIYNIYIYIYIYIYIERERERERVWGRAKPAC
jgi:hypothetical protein